MAKGCTEKFDLEFAKWILFLGRTKSARERYAKVISDYKDKVVVIKNQKQLDAFIKML